MSAVAVNWAYTKEHDAVRALPPLSPRHPLLAARDLVRTRPWLIAFGAETFGWLMFVAALHLAPLALVQAVGAAGIAVLAMFVAKGHPSRLPRHEQLAVACAVVGLVLLGLSLPSHQPGDHAPHVAEAALWLGVTAGVAAVLSVAHLRASYAATLGFAAGLLFAGGDISAKLFVFGGGWFLAIAPLIAYYGLGSIQLQGAFQQGDAVTAAGAATLTTNAVPIAAGIVLLDEQLPGGASGVLRIASFALLVASGTLLSRPRGSSQRSSNRSTAA
ncbi:MAG TPA: hypothetical protein VGH82_04025 [Gaiellaceae bacterium]